MEFLEEEVFWVIIREEDMSEWFQLFLEVNRDNFIYCILYNMK